MWRREWDSNLQYACFIIAPMKMDKALYVFLTLLHESRNGTVRLNTGDPADESTGSKQKYPSLSNWYGVPDLALDKLGSRRHEDRVTNEFGFRLLL